ncbi:hypothetical protein SO802_012463 [Lithocarpus litseifolius]|uniref:Uncharacterized protein n=1 Tax=Lithocarpus litseifolius TaxID=425828 RepID=A0AAW2D3F3_9ROSI
MQLATVRLYKYNLTVAGFKLISTRFQSPKHVIKAKDSRLALIDVVVPKFLNKPLPSGTQDAQLPALLLAKLLYSHEQPLPSNDEWEELSNKPTQEVHDKDFKVFYQEDPKNSPTFAYHHLVAAHGIESEQQSKATIWNPAFMLSSGDPITFEASLRDDPKGRSGLVFECLEKALLLPDDMQELKGLRKCEVFLLLKRDLAKVDHALSKSREEKGKLVQSDKDLADFEKKYKDLPFHLAEAEIGHKNAEASLAGFKRQAKKLRASLKKSKTQLGLANEQIKCEKKQLEGKDAEKAKAYDIGMIKTAQSLTAQLRDVARAFCIEVWGKALNAAGVSANAEKEKGVAA